MTASTLAPSATTEPNITLISDDTNDTEAIRADIARVIANCPEWLKAHTCFVLWDRIEQTDPSTGELKIVKLPIDPVTREAARWSDPANRLTWDRVAKLADGLLLRIGCVLPENTVCVDLDRSLDDGGLNPIAGSCLERFGDTYTEVSTSGCGLHALIGLADMWPYRARKVPGVELYGPGRFIALTGDLFQDSTSEVKTFDVGDVRSWFEKTTGAQLEPARPASDGYESLPAPASPNYSDDEVIQLFLSDKNFGEENRRLWEGDLSDFPKDNAHGCDRSKADFYLCKGLSYYTQDPDQIERLWAESALWGNKAREFRNADSVYVQPTIKRALEDRYRRGAFYASDIRDNPAWKTTSGDSRTHKRGDTVSVGDGSNWERRFKSESLGEFLDGEPPAFRVEDFLVEGGLTVAFGESGSLKSFMLLDVLLSAALGRDTMGRTTKRSRVVLVIGEGASGARLRIKAWLKHHNVSLADLAGWFHVIRDAPQLVRSDDITYVIEEADSIVDAHGPIDIFAFDTLARVFDGDENSTADMTRFIANTGRLQSQYQAGVWVVHHTNRSGEYRGSSVLRGAADTMIQYDKTDVANRIGVSCFKQKDGPFFPSFSFEGVPVNLATGNEAVNELTSSLVVVRKDNLGPVRIAASADALTLLRILAEHEDGLGSTKWKTASGLDQKSFTKARQWLVNNEYVTKVGESNKSPYVVTQLGFEHLEMATGGTVSPVPQAA